MVRKAEWKARALVAETALADERARVQDLFDRLLARDLTEYKVGQQITMTPAEAEDVPFEQVDPSGFFVASARDE